MPEHVAGSGSRPSFVLLGLLSNSLPPREFEDESDIETGTFLNTNDEAMRTTIGG
jgi:hypothetical protein